MRKQYRLIFEEPPVRRTGQHGAIKSFVSRLREHPNRWAVLTREAKSTGYYYRVARDNEDLQIRVARNIGASTYTIYFRIVPVGETVKK